MGIKRSTVAESFRRQSPELPGNWFFRGRMKARPHRVVVDESLLTTERSVTQVCLPLSPTPGLTLRTGSGTLLLAAAMTVMADTVPDEAALLSLAATLGFTPDKFLRGCPVLAETSLGSVPGRIVRDGKGQRAYYLGTPDVLASLCSRIWDGGERPMTGEDLQQIPNDSHCAMATAPVHEGVPGEATYLGSLLVENAPTPATLAAMDALRRQGLEVIIRRPGEDFGHPADALAVSCEPTDMPCLIPTADTLQGLDGAVSAIIRSLQTAQEQRRALWQATLLLLLCGLAMRADWQSVLINTFAFAAGCFLGRQLRQPARHWLRRLTALLLSLLTAALTAAFMAMVAPEQALLLRGLAHRSLCLSLLVPAMSRPRWVPVLLLCGVAALTAIDALCFRAGLAAVFASLSGVLCAAVYGALLRQDARS